MNQPGGNVTLITGESFHGESGTLHIGTAKSTFGHSGSAFLTTGNTENGDSGMWTISTGNAQSGHAGKIVLNPGISGIGNGAEVLISSGFSDDLNSAGGNFSLLSGGNPFFSSGSIFIQTHDSGTSGTSGLLSLKTGQGVSSSGSIHVSTGSTSGTLPAGEIIIEVCNIFFPLLFLNLYYKIWCD